MYTCKPDNGDVEITLTRKEYQSLQARDEFLRDVIDMLATCIQNLTINDTLYQAINDDLKDWDK